jgi:hypothetical protein
LFGGGDYSGGCVEVEVYDTSLTQTIATNLSAARGFLAATSVGNYALFGGGNDSSQSSYYSTVDAYVVA